jgi:hypothetical protein
MTTGSTDIMVYEKGLDRVLTRRREGLTIETRMS